LPVDGSQREPLVVGGIDALGTDFVVAIFFKARILPFTAGVKPTTPLTFHRRLQSEYPTTANLY